MIVLSDLHFGIGDRADDFGPVGGEAEKTLIQQIDTWRAAKQDVVLVGDILDIWESPLNAILAAHGPVIEHLFSIVKVYVIGNHDAQMLGRGMYGVEGLRNAVVDGCWFEHGDNYDDVISKHRRLSRIVSGLGAWLERRVHRDVDRWFLGIAGWVGRIGRHGQNKRYLDQIAVEATLRQCKLAVFGHTHKAMRLSQLPSLPVRVGNCGTWTAGRRDFLKL